MKKKIFMLPCIAAVAIATFVGKQAYESSAHKSNELLMANVEALADNEEFKCVMEKDDCHVRVGRYAKLQAFINKYSGYGNLEYGDEINITDLTCIYSAATIFNFWKPRVRCGEDYRCIDIARMYGFTQL